MQAERNQREHASEVTNGDGAYAYDKAYDAYDDAYDDADDADVPGLPLHEALPRQDPTRLHRGRT